ncbi:MAG TPA: choice-of-anchor D domain-containing protein [Bacteroidota bacterium]|nr:choice-of-anchor D domain-containing protein [Bacteroidota bacterium]
MKNCRLLLSIAALTALFLLAPASGLAQVSNDECSTATVISSLPDSIVENTALASANATDPAIECAQDSIGKDGKTVWFTFTPNFSGVVTFTTINSPDVGSGGFDVAMGIFTGACGSLTLWACNDDINPGRIRQSQIVDSVTAGVTYYILIGEWNNGGPNGGTPTGGTLVFQVYQGRPSNLPPTIMGPKSGSIAHGDSVNVAGFSNSLSAGNEGSKGEHEAAENPRIKYLPWNKKLDELYPSTGPAGSNYFEMKHRARIQSEQGVVNSQPIALKNFVGMNSSENNCGCIPPDPTSAVGPNQVIDAINLAFKIFDKNGTNLKTIDFSNWYAGTGASFAGSDPQVAYDQFSGRWIMTLLNTTDPSQIFLSVSKTSDAMGEWYNWVMPGSLGDSVVQHLNDQPFVGYDDKAIYITTREFNSQGNQLYYQRVRIIAKAQLYANTAGPVTWTDFWGLTDPISSYVNPDDIRPYVAFSAPGNQAFLMSVAPFSPGNYAILWTIHDPLGSPSITAVDVPTIQYTPPPGPGELGGGGVDWEGGSLNHKPVFRDSSIWMAHAITNPGNNTYSAISYLKINPYAGTNLEDIAFGENNAWHYYPNIMVNKNHDLMFTYTRSSPSEYPSAYFTGRRVTDAPGVDADVVLKSGLSNYSIGAPTSVRWGDYMGIGLDPSDSLTFWIHTEYAAAGNDYGTWNGQVAMAPFVGKIAYVPATSFSLLERGFTKDTTITVTNYGNQTVTVDSVAAPDSNFSISGLPTFPQVLNPFDSFVFNLRFNPKTRGDLSSAFTVYSNDSYNPVNAVAVSGPAFQVDPIPPGSLYATTGGANIGGRVFTVDTSTGNATFVGNTGSIQVVSVRQNPLTHEMIGLIPSATLVRIDVTLGDQHPFLTIPGLIALKGMVFKNDTLYIAQGGGRIYRIDLSTGNPTLVCNTSLPLTGLDLNPQTGEIYACVGSGGTPDRIYKINLSTGGSTIVGSTGMGATQDIVFDGLGNLYGVTGTGNTTNTLIRINPTNAHPTVIGTMGTNSIDALALVPDSVLGSHDFGYVQTGTGKTDSITITNTLGVSDSISLVTTTDPADFTVSPSGVNLGSGASQKFAVTFNSASHGVKHAEMLISFKPFLLRGVIGLTASALSPGATPVSVSQYWNIVSVPLLVSSTVKDSLFPTATTSAYAYQSSTYAQKDTLAFGVGYWLKFGGAQLLELSGNLLLTDSIPVVAGWNLIGSVDHTVQTGVVTTSGPHIKTKFFGYNHGYAYADSIVPGSGYWVKTDAAGSLILPGAGSNSSSASRKPVGNLSPNSSISGYASLTIEDAAHNSQTLYFGERMETSPEAGYFEKPPVPPSGIFDARYSTNTNVELIENGKSKEIPVNLYSAVYPITVRWNSGAVAVSGVLNENGTKIPLSASGSIKIASASSLSLKISGTRALPTAFALGQNYPNPFNPTTMIRYDLPVDAKVSLAIFDVLGRKVATLIDGQQSAGFKTIEWNSTNDEGITVPSGVYFYRMSAGNFSAVKKLLLLK